MTSINRLNQVDHLNENDSFPIWDAANGRTRRVTADQLAKHFTPTTDVHVESGVYNSGTLTLTLTDKSTVVVTGFGGETIDLGNLKASEIPMMGPNGKLVYSGVSIDSGTVRIPENTLGFGEPLTLGAATGFGLIHNRVTDASFILLDSYLSDKTGSARPNHYFISPPTLRAFQSDKTNIITDNPLSFEYDTQFDGGTFSLTFEASAPMTNVKIEIIDRKTGIPFKHIPSRVAWDDDAVAGMNFRVGTNTLDFFSDKPDDPANGIFNIGFSPIILVSGWQLTVVIKADNISILGNSAKIPAMSGMLGTAAFRGLAYQDELSSKAEFIELPEVYNNMTATEWLTVMQDKASGMNSAYFVCKGLGSTFKNIDLTFHPLSTYWATSFVVHDPKTGAWAQRVSFATDSDWPDNARTFQRAGSTAQVAMVSGFRKFAFESDISSGHLSIGANFVGIYTTLQDLKDAISAPANNYQAIVISPSEKYYHGVGNAWVELAPVGSIHPNYLGVYDTVDDLKAAQPNAKEKDIAIVGTLNKVFYIKGVSDWESIKGTDLPALTGRVASLETLTQDTKARVAAVEGDITNLPKFDPSIYQSAVDHGYAADDQGLRSSTTTDGWWVFKDLKSISGRPVDSVGDLSVFKKTTDSSNVALRNIFMMAIGKDTTLKTKVWFRYRDSTTWTPWIDQEGADQPTIDGINAEIAKLKSGDAAVVSQVGQLSSRVGNIYAPNQLAFNKAVTALISAALANYTPAKPGHGGDKPSLVFPRFYAQFSLGVPTDFTGATTSTNAEATLLRIPTTRERIFISVENDNDEASKVTGFKFNNKQEMSLAHRDIVRNGKKYRAFYTAGAFSEKKVDIKVDFGQGI